MNLLDQTRQAAQVTACLENTNLNPTNNNNVLFNDNGGEATFLGGPNKDGFVENEGVDLS